MIDVPLKGIHKVRKRLADGSVRTYYYAFRGGPRLEGEPGSPEFLDSFAKAIRRDPPPGLFGSILRRYEASPEFEKLRDRTKADYRLFLTKIEDEFGDLPVAALNDPAVREDFLAWRDKMAGSPKRADYAWTVLKRVLSWAKDRGIILFNHAERGGRLYHADRSEMIWTPEEVANFLALAPAPLRLAMILAKETGQRQGDLLKLPWTAFGPGEDGRWWIVLRQSKGGRKVEIPVTAELRTALDAAPRTATTILTSSTGRPWTQKGFWDAWRAAARKAGIRGKTFHDLRGTAVTRLAEARCELPEICAITGHSLRDAGAILDRYLARTRSLATAAIIKLEGVKK